MRFFRRGQHQPITRGPIPPDDTSPIPRIRTGLLQPLSTPLPFRQTSPSRSPDQPASGHECSPPPSHPPPRCRP